MRTLEAALSLAERGFHVFPLQPDSKLPAIKDFPKLATRDPKKIKAWWIDPVLEIERPYNVGISTSAFGENGEALVVVDVDNKGKKKGSEELIGLELNGQELPLTYEQATPTGGSHLVFTNKTALKQGVNVLAKGLDIRSKGGYIVGAGSVIDKKKYSMRGNLIPAPCPKWVADKCGAAPKKEKREALGTNINEEHAHTRAKQYLINEAPLSKEGEGGDATAYAVAARVKDFGVTPFHARELMLDHWNDRCEPPWSAEEIETKVERAFKYGVNNAGASAPEIEFEKIEGDSEDFYLNRINNQYALIFEDGGHSILFETVDQKGRPKRSFMSEQSFKRKMSPYIVTQGKGKPLSYADIWLDWKKRRQYQGLCFTPERQPGHNYYNLWRGFTCKSTPYAEAGASAKAGFDAFMEHAEQNVCAGDKDLFKWLMGYFAHLIQKPYERPLTTLVFKGSKGTGKNALIDRIGNLLGQGSYLVAHDGRYLTSNFNGHMDSCLCLVLDEAFWSGDKAAEGKLKGLTTSSEILIERKGKEIFPVDNLIRLVVIGNEDWLVPATADERRYAVFEVGDGRKQDRSFFANMRRCIDDFGGNEVLIDYFKKFDLKTVDVDCAPNTAGLLQQKLSSLTPFEQFWYDCLTEGALAGSDLHDKWETNMDKSIFRMAFSNYCKERNIRSRSPSVVGMGKWLRGASPSCDTRARLSKGGSRHRVYIFSDLDTCRNEWETKMGRAIDWEAP